MAMSGVALLASDRPSRQPGPRLPAADRRDAAGHGTFFAPLDETGRLEVPSPLKSQSAASSKPADQAAFRWPSASPFPLPCCSTAATGEPRFRHMADELFAFRSHALSRGTCPPAGRRAGLAACSTQHRGGALSRHRPPRRAADHGLSDAGRLVYARPDPGAWCGEPAAFAPFIYDVTAEFVLWLTLIAANVAANIG